MFAIALSFVLATNQPAATPLAAASPTVRPLVDESLQEFLRRARKERNAILDALRAEVEAAVERVEKLNPRGRAVDLRLARQALREHGPASASLLVEHLDAGEQPTAAQARRAREVQSALRDLGVQTIAGRLYELAQTAPRPTRVKAIELLGLAPADPKLDAWLEEAAVVDAKVVRLAAFGACVQRETPGLDTLIERAIEDDDQDVIATLFQNLPEGQPERLQATFVRTFSSGIGIDDWLPLSLHRLAELEQPFEKSFVSTLGPVLGDSGHSTEVRASLLDTLADLEPIGDKTFKKDLQALAKDVGGRLRTSALVCLAIMGDKKSKNRLLEKYNDGIDDNKGWAKAYDERGKILLRIRDYNAAARDFSQAVEIDENRGNRPNQETRLNLARAYAGGKKLRQAHDALKEADPSTEELAVLAQEAVFQELVKHSRYGKLFKR